MVVIGAHSISAGQTTPKRTRAYWAQHLHLSYFLEIMHTFLFDHSIPLFIPSSFFSRKKMRLLHPHHGSYIHVLYMCNRVLIIHLHTYHILPFLVGYFLCLVLLLSQVPLDQQCNCKYLFSSISNCSHSLNLMLTLIVTLIQCFTIWYFVISVGQQLRFILQVLKSYTRTITSGCYETFLIGILDLLSLLTRMAR